jgi:hypothetical protein
MAALAREVLCRHGDPGGDDDVRTGGGVVGAGDAQQRQVRSSVTADSKARSNPVRSKWVFHFNLQCFA